MFSTVAGAINNVVASSFSNIQPISISIDPKPNQPIQPVQPSVQSGAPQSFSGQTFVQNEPRPSVFASSTTNQQG